jgi:ElaB/YqjD/DUF883 family membrane-anchored ribosome-binding protein
LEVFVAKRRRKSGSPTLNATAETLGTALGHLAAKLDAWKKQRAEIAAEIQHVASNAQKMLSDLGHTAGAAAQRVRKGGRPKGYKMSAATKAKLRAAWKRRKAAMAAKNG